MGASISCKAKSPESRLVQSSPNVSIHCRCHLPDLANSETDRILRPSPFDYCILSNVKSQLS